MRLIDADALDAAFTDLRFNADGTLAHWGDRPDWCLHGREVEKLIHDAPTVEPEPKVLTAKETIADIGHVSHCYVEVKGDSKIYGAYRDKQGTEYTSIACDVPDLPDLLVSGKARLWSEYPTDEQRKAVKWND